MKLDMTGSKTDQKCSKYVVLKIAVVFLHNYFKTRPDEKLFVLDIVRDKNSYFHVSLLAWILIIYWLSLTHSTLFRLQLISSKVIWNWARKRSRSWTRTPFQRRMLLLLQHENGLMLAFLSRSTEDSVSTLLLTFIYLFLYLYICLHHLTRVSLFGH